MSIVITDDKHYKAIADKVRELKGTEETMLPSEMADKVQEIFEAGKLARDKEWWDEYLQNGKPTDFYYLFAGRYWNDDNFKPPYPIKVTTSPYMMFAKSYINVKDVDFSEAPNLDYCFYWTRGREIDLGSVAKSTSFINTFAVTTSLKSVTMKDVRATATFTTMFGTNAVTKLDLTGSIGRSFAINTLSKLEAKWARNIINILVNYAGTSNEFKYKLTLHADVWTRLDDTTAEDYEAPPSGATWKDYVYSKGWTY